MTLPYKEVFIEPHPRRIQAILAGTAVIDTEQALLVHRPGHHLAYAFPADQVGDLAATAVPEAEGFVQVPWDAVDLWIEEGRELVSYPPNPYHRVDCRPTDRRLHIVLNATTIVDTTDTVILFETGLPARLYVAKQHLRGALTRSETTTYCNYKGWATYWSCGEIEDIAWSYEDPLPESEQIRGLVSFEVSCAAG